MRIETTNIPQYSNSNSQVQDGRKEAAPVKRVERQIERTAMPAETKGEAKQTVDESQVIKAIENANVKIKHFDRRLEFSIHEGTKQIMVKVIDTEDDSIIREIPSEKILDMVAKLWEMAGIFVDERR